jgi:uncharacterized membrane-anchored protein YitT (DUF2179 family)
LLRIFTLIIGAAIAAIGLEMFLVPNGIMDGGIVGISIILAHLSSLPLGLFIFVLNLPFLYFGYKQIGKTFTLSTLLAIMALSGFVTIFHPIHEWTNDLLLVTVFGGLALGVGVGIILRAGGSLDGTEIVAVMFDHKVPFSVGEIIMFFNIFIMSAGGLVFGWERAMYSLIAYFVAFKTIDIVMQGLDEARAVMIISTCNDDISAAIRNRLGRGVTHLHGRGGHSGEEMEVLYTVVSRLEFAKLRQLIHNFDPDAFITVEQVHDVMGGRLHKKAIH